MWAGSYFWNYNCNQKEERLLNSLSSFWWKSQCLFDEKGKHDQPGEKCARKDPNAHKVFLNRAVIGVEFHGRRRCCHAKCCCWSFVFLSHFISPNFVIAQRQQCAGCQQDMDSMRSRLLSVSRWMPSLPQLWVQLILFGLQCRHIAVGASK